MPAEPKSWRQQRKELAPIVQESRKLLPIIPEGVTPSLSQLVAYDRLSEAHPDERIQATKLVKQKTARDLLAARAQMEIGAEYADPDHTGFSEYDIPDAYVALVRVLHLWGGLVVYHPDRLTRHPKVAEMLLDVYKSNPHLTFLCTGNKYDLTTDEGRQDFRDAIGDAHRQSLATRRRDQDHHRLLKESGSPSGKRCFGIGVQVNGKWDQTQLHPVEAGHLRLAAIQVIAGRTLQSITDEWSVRGIYTTHGNHWRPQKLKVLLQNPRVAGWRVVKDGGEKAKVYHSELDGQPVLALHPAILDQDTFDLVRVALAQKARASTDPGKVSSGLLTGLGRCGVDGNVIHYASGYLKCSKGGCVQIKTAPVEEKLIGLCLDRWANPPVETVTTVEPFSGQAELDAEVATKAETMGLFHAKALTPADLAAALAPLNVRIAELEAERRRWVASTQKAKVAITSPVEMWHASFSDPDGANIRRRMICATLEAFILSKSEGLERDYRGRPITDLTRVHPVWV